MSNTEIFEPDRNESFYFRIVLRKQSLPFRKLPGVLEVHFLDCAGGRKRAVFFEALFEKNVNHFLCEVQW